MHELKLLYFVYHITRLTFQFSFSPFLLAKPSYLPSCIIQRILVLIFPATSEMNKYSSCTYSNHGECLQKTTKNSKTDVCDKNALSKKLRVKPVLGQIVNFCMSVLSAKIKALHESMFYYFSLIFQWSFFKVKERKKEDLLGIKKEKLYVSLTRLGFSDVEESHHI